MDDSALSKELWQISNVLTGFSVVQTLAFSFACTKPEFRYIVHTFWCKFSIAIAIIVGTMLEAYLIWWCASKYILLYKNSESYNKGIDDYLDHHIQIIRQSARGSIIICLLVIPVFLCLYAPQLIGIPYNKESSRIESVAH